MRIGIFGGTFNPVHLGHLRLAFAAHEVLDLDKTYLVPAFKPVHKDEPDIEVKHRLKMLKLALKKETWAKVSKRELKNVDKPYTLDTVRYFREKFPEANLYLLIGGDSFLDFNKWHKYREIIKYCNIIVLPRKSDKKFLNTELQALIKQSLIENLIGIKSSKHGGLYFLSTGRINIASSQVREIIQQDKSPKYLVPDAVLTYISAMRLYSNGS